MSQSKSIIPKNPRDIGIFFDSVFFQDQQFLRQIFVSVNCMSALGSDTINFNIYVCRNEHI